MCAPIVFRAALRVGAQEHFAAAESIEVERIGVVAEKLQMLHRVQPVGATGMSGHKNQIAVLRSGCVETEKVVHLRRLVVLVCAEYADVQVVARIPAVASTRFG